MAKQNLGMVTAYAYAMAGGYTGTEAEFEALLGNIATDLEEIENLTVTATTLPEGSSATASYSDGVLTLGIPKGDTGATGAGATATAGTTTTGEPGTDASVVNSGTTKDAVFDFTIPRGDTGNGIESITLTSTVGAVHTYTITFTDGDTTTFEVTDGEVTSDALTAILADYAKTDGAYESMTVGNAEQLISSVYVTDEEPYQFRTSGGSADIGDREFDTLVGGSVALNQYANPLADGTYANVTLSVDANGVYSCNGVANGGFPLMQQNLQHLSGHKYLMLFDFIANPNNLSLTIGMGSGVPYWTNVSTSKAQIYTNTYSTRVSIFSASGIDFTGAKFRLQIVDLTQMLGSTVADYIATLESGQAGAGVAFFRKYFPKPYYPYDAGTIKSVEGVSAHKTVGFNQWDEEWEVGNIDSGNPTVANDRIRSKNYIPVVGGATYYTTGRICWYEYDADKNFIKVGNSGSFVENQTFTVSSNCAFIKFKCTTAYGTTYNHDICINLSWDGERDGEYEPYVEHSYPLDDSLTLRGIPKIANGKLYYDGDEYPSDGTVTRKWKQIDLDGVTVGKKFNGAFGAVTNGYAVYMDISGYSQYASGVTGLSNRFTYGSFDRSTAPLYQFGGSDGGAGTCLFILPSTITSLAEANAWLQNNPTSIIVKLATPTTETAEPFTNPQIVDDFGTEEYVTTSIVPVGHSTKYTNNLKAKLEMSPESPSGDGLYLVQQSSGQNAYVQYISPVPSNPSTDGTYVLKATVSGGTATLTWVAE